MFLLLTACWSNFSTDTASTEGDGKGTAPVDTGSSDSDSSDSDSSDSDSSDSDSSDSDSSDSDSGETAAEPDADGDGYTTSEGDCDDAVTAVHPGADEACNEVDDDCDGSVDEGPPAGAALWYPDDDTDGYGSEGGAVTACEAPDGFVDNAEDCDDTDPSVNPAASELCNERDDDCDGGEDEAPIDPTTWYRDADGDGWGDDLVTQEACAAPATYLATAGDCDDLESTVNPDGVELCNDVDDDCDATVDEDAADASTWYADTDGDGFGDPLSTTRACAAPATYLADASDCDDSDTRVNPDAAEFCADAADDNCDGLVPLCEDGDIETIAAATLSGTPDGDTIDGFGYDVRFTTGGSETWLAIGAPFHGTDGDDSAPGRVYAYALSGAGVPSSPDAIYDGSINSEELGCALDGENLLSGDAEPELVLATNSTGAWIVSPTAGIEVSVEVAAERTLSGDPGTTRPGTSVAVGDFDGGSTDVVLLADADTTGEALTGRAWMVSGTALGTGDVTLGTSADDMDIRGPFAGQRLGTAANGGDLNNDLTDDLVVGSWGTDSSGNTTYKGTISIFFTPWSVDPDRASSVGTDDADVVLDGEAEGDRLAVAAYVPGVAGGDEPMLAVGAEGAPDSTGADTDAGRVYLLAYDDVWPAPVEGTSIGAVARYTLVGDAGDTLTDGWHSITSGDLDGDGNADLVVGAPSADGSDGRVYVAWGPLSEGVHEISAVSSVLSGPTDSELGFAVDVMDVDGDGVDDLAAGAPHLGADGFGAVFLVLGASW